MKSYATILLLGLVVLACVIIITLMYKIWIAGPEDPRITETKVQTQVEDIRWYATAYKVAFIAILAVLLVIIGIVIIVLWITGGGFSFNLFSREPTPTMTLPPTPILSPTPSLIPTETPTPTLTVSPTPSGPFEYTVLEFDSCWGIAEKFEVDLQTLLALNNFEDGNCPISPDQKIKVPAPGQTLPTATPSACPI